MLICVVVNVFNEALFTGIDIYRYRAGLFSTLTPQHSSQFQQAFPLLLPADATPFLFSFWPPSFEHKVSHTDKVKWCL